MDRIIEPKAKFHIEILLVLKDAQQQHGLRHKDFQSYHQYITRKLHRMRKSLGFSQGKGNRVTPKKITKAILTDSRYLLIKLFESERAWAHAMQLKSESNTEPRKVYHMKSRLNKAVKRAGELWELCRWGQCDEHQRADECDLCDKCDAHTYVEAQAYFYAMQAVRFFEIAKWRDAKAMYEKAFVEYSGLAAAVDKDQQAVYEGKCEELRPLIRYCANNDGGSVGSTVAEESVGGEVTALRDMEQLSGQLLQQIYRNQMAVMTEVNWMGIVIPVKRDNVRVAILALNDAHKALAKGDSAPVNDRIAIYDGLLKTCTEALQVVRDDLKGGAVVGGVGTVSAGAVGQANPAQISNMNLETMSRLQLLFAYMHYVKLAKTVERNLLLIESHAASAAGKPQNMARLYDSVTQNLQEMAGLPGLSRDSNASGNAHQEIQAKIAAYTAFRCYHLSQAHLLMKRFAECAALLTRTLRHGEAALANLHLLIGGTTGSDGCGGVAINGRLIPGPALPAMVQQVAALVDCIGADQLICRANRCLSMIDDTAVEVLPATSDNVELPLAKRLDEFVEDPYLSKKTTSQSAGRLIQTCPDFEPIPVKPVFFDLAFYHVKFPSLDDKIKDKKGRPTDNKGLTGMVKGWLWGSK